MDNYNTVKQLLLDVRHNDLLKAGTLALKKTSPRTVHKAGLPIGHMLSIGAQQQDALKDSTIRGVFFYSAKHVGARVVRVQLYCYLDDSRRSEHWGQALSFIKAAAKKGFRVQLVIGAVAYSGDVPSLEGDFGFMPWSTSDKQAAKRVAQFKRFCADAKQYFGKRVHRYSIWNEPNYQEFLVVGKSAEQHRTLRNQGKRKEARVLFETKIIKENAAMYQRLYRAGSKVLKRPLWGELSSRKAIVFMNEALKSSTSPADVGGIALHPYQFTESPIARSKRYDGGIGNLAAIQRWARGHRKWLYYKKSGVVPPIYLTEFGYKRRGDAWIPEAKRSAWLRVAVLLAWVHGVKQLVIYQMLGAPDEKWDTSLLKRNGKLPWAVEKNGKLPRKNGKIVVKKSSTYVELAEFHKRLRSKQMVR